MHKGTMEDHLLWSSTHTQQILGSAQLTKMMADIVTEISAVRKEYGLPERSAVPLCNADHEPNLLTVSTFESEEDDAKLPRFSTTEELFADLGI